MVFSGYSDIALERARTFRDGFTLRNFAFPYFSRDMAELEKMVALFYISWLKILYIPLGGSTKGGNWMRIRNIL